ncbi:SDR family oxidoreductase [Lysobacter silvisoli]|uniref:SDR family NAD(P)-dependent oxidoreductase n=1 Tax=Lysobacter silvisoli TaxID=2293254 RepID=A0A371K2X1_9GAMM|nr:SDR family oxidoreductase [Lysobacter silvisoli]RDZ28197.1 SDR family NAD(P)-dependent oxidoreductase [Lysobacter silvisoli]
MTARLQGKVAIVTGASSGIGRASALCFAREGASVVLSARGADRLAAVAAEIESAGGQAIAVAGDVRDEAHAQALVRTAQQRYGGLDIAFNNAGGLGVMAPTPELSLAQWRDTLDNNLTGAFLGAKYQLPALLERGGGSLIFTSSFVGDTAAFPGLTAYAAAKAALLGLARSIAVEFGPRGVRSNALLPGATDTPAFREFGDDEQTRAYVAGLYALKRVAAAEEIAQAALFLASDASSFMTGSTLAVEGGVSVNRG